MAIATAPKSEEGVLSVADSPTRCDVRDCGRLIRAGELHLHFPGHKKAVCLSCVVGKDR